jgi:hypothetical protein
VVNSLLERLDDKFIEDCGDFSIGGRNGRSGFLRQGGQVIVERTRLQVDLRITVV